MPNKVNVPEILKKFREFYKERHRAPTLREITRLLGYQSRNAAFELVQKLVQKGFLKKDKRGMLLFDSLKGVKLLGTVQAGWPSPAEEELVDTLSLDEYLIKHPEQTFLIKVTGDSMIEAGIHEADLVLVERGRNPKDKDIVIAQVDGEWTMKYYEKRGTGVKLIAANKKYAPIIPKRELVIAGVVVAVIRKYK